MSALAQAAAATGEFDRAEDLARAITDPYEHAEAVSALAQAAAATGEHDRARRLLSEAEDLARAITNQGDQAKAVSALAQAAAATGEFDRAEDLARAITRPVRARGGGERVGPGRGRDRRAPSAYRHPAAHAITSHCARRCPLLWFLTFDKPETLSDNDVRLLSPRTHPRKCQKSQKSLRFHQMNHGCGVACGWWPPWSGDENCCRSGDLAHLR